MKQYGTVLIMGISIHTGEVVVGNIGFDKKMDYTVIGDSANFVFKLQDLCKSWPNGIIISEKTYFASQFPPAIDEIGDYETEQDMGKIRIYRVIGLPKQRYEPSNIVNERRAPEPVP